MAAERYLPSRINLNLDHQLKSITSVMSQRVATRNDVSAQASVLACLNRAHEQLFRLCR